jgi:uroporphyrinogen-III synthase
MSTAPNFSGLRVLLLESRRAQELASIVTSYGGRPTSAPSMREVPIDSNPEAIAFADALDRDEFGLVILLTGVGTRALVNVIERVRGTKESFLDALRRTRMVARGPKPVAVLRELNVPVWATAPEPNTWREVLTALDAKATELSLRGLLVAVQEYGETNAELLAGLEARGARVTRVPVYQWALPEDVGPLQAGIRAIAEDGIDVILFTTTTQVVHLMQVASTMGLQQAVQRGIARLVVASIGPTTTEALRKHGIAPDFEPSHPKMGFLVREAAERARDLLNAKRAT